MAGAVCPGCGVLSMIKDSEKVAVIELYGAAKFDQVFIERRRKNEQTAKKAVK
jgi:hypothetical protein